MADGSVTYEIKIDDKGAASAIENVKNQATQTGATGASAFDGMTGAAKKFVAALAAIGIVQKIGEIGSAALSAYADYEQLVGGVETLFKESAGTVQAYAANAYQTAGLSANQYMETVTSFSASLLQGLGGDTEAAAAYADMAISDMSDNANKMGTDISMIQNAYQGFAKQNYTMLDNLKLGYGGTKTEMERLIADANALKEANGEMANLTIESYADVVEAIHLVQDNMGITGTTAKEAATTITGSANAMKAAWENLLVGMVDSSANKTELIKQLLDSVRTYLGNLLPAIGSMIQGFIDSLPDMMNSILELAVQLIDDISDNLPTLIDNLTQCLAALIQAVIEHIPQILEAGVRLIIGLGSGLIKAIPQLIANVPTVILSLFDALVNGVPQMIQAGIQLIMGLEEGETATLPQMLDFIASIPSKIISFLGDMGSLLWNAGSQIIAGFLNGIRAKFEEVKSFVSGIGDWIASHKGPEQYDKTLLIKQGGWIMESLATGLNEGKSEVLDALNGITADISGYTVDANLQPSATSGVFNNTTIVNINGITSSSPSVLEAAGNLVSAVQLDLRMGVA